MPELLTFGILSALLLFFTLRRPYRHRFFRYFAFEGVLALVLRQAKTWFSDPLAPVQIISWLCLASSLLLAVQSVRLLKSLGEPVEDIEATTRLVTQGVYHYIRHPLYGSLLLVGVGALLKDVDLVSLLLFLVLSIFVVATALVEEQENLIRFGETYRRYMNQTRMFIPYVF